MLTNSPGGLHLWEKLRHDWLRWATRGSTFALRLDRLINTLMGVLSIGFVRALLLWIVYRAWK